MTVGKFIRNTFILTGVMLAVWAFLAGLADRFFGDTAPGITNTGSHIDLLSNSLRERPGVRMVHPSSVDH